MCRCPTRTVLHSFGQFGVAEREPAEDQLNDWSRIVKTRSFLFAVAFGLVMPPGALAVEVDPALPPYKASQVGDATIKSVGSDTLGDLMRIWAGEFTKLNPNVKIDVDSRGSGTATAALLEGTAQLGPMSRPMRSEEYEPFEKKFGYHPASLPVAVDALAVYVNKDNPIECLTIEQLDQIFSKTHLFSGGKNVKTWGDLGLTGDWASQPVVLFGRNSASGTFDTFVDAALAHGEFKNELKEQPGSAEVVKMVAADKFAIGYSGIGYLTTGVRAVPLAANAADKCHDTSPEATYSGAYPLARYLYVYLNKSPAKPVDAAVLEFLKYVLSRDGQKGTVKSGFYPITNAIRMRDLSTLGVPITQ
jgi:phosphate transport system substrate-binding protein